MLVVVVAVQVGVVVVQVPVPGVVRRVLGSTPPDAVVAKVVERTCVVTVATRKGRKKVSSPLLYKYLSSRTIFYS